MKVHDRRNQSNKEVDWQKVFKYFENAQIKCI